MIATCAKKLGCDKVIAGTHGRGIVTQRLMESACHAAIHEMDPRIPVTLVKTGYGTAASRCRRCSLSGTSLDDRSQC